MSEIYNYTVNFSETYVHLNKNHIAAKDVLPRFYVSLIWFILYPSHRNMHTT